jgi:flavin reductase (DIM6/NTAB) family NADH-FMN oxidoreductase RutF
MTDVPARTLTATASFRALMARFPTGVSIVTTMDENGRPWGMTCSSVCSVTLTPPTLLVCLRTGSPTLRAMLLRGSFAVNFLHEWARPTAELFASGAPDRFDLVRWRQDADACGPRLVDAALATADCRVDGTWEVGDHVVVLGATVGITEGLPWLPLLYGLRQYRSWPA